MSDNLIWVSAKAEGVNTQLIIPTQQIVIKTVKGRNLMNCTMKNQLRVNSAYPESWTKEEHFVSVNLPSVGAQGFTPLLLDFCHNEGTGPRSVIDHDSR